MKFLRQCLFIFVAVFFTAFIFAQNEFEDFEELDYFETEDIACEDLPSAFGRYRDDVQLNQISLQKSLASATQLLRKISKEGLVEEELLQMIKTLEEMSALSMDNSGALSNQAYDISYFLPECLNSSK